MFDTKEATKIMVSHNGNEGFVCDSKSLPVQRQTNSPEQESLAPAPPYSLSASIDKLRVEAAEIRQFIAHCERTDENISLIEQQVTSFGKKLARLAEHSIEFNVREYENELLDIQDIGGHTTTEREKLVEDHRNRSMEALNLAYVSMIAKMRPIGGVINDNELSSPELLAKMNRTVGTFYPQDWIDASNIAGPLAIRYVSGRSHYHSQATDNVYNKDGWYAKKRIVGIPEHVVDEYLSKMSEDGDVIKLADAAPFACEGSLLRIIVHPERIPYHGENAVDNPSTPTGDEWKYGHVLTMTGDISEEKTWYRYEYRRPDENNTNPSFPSINISQGSHPGAMSQAMYHEFCHRAEAVVNNGIIMQLEEAFLIRRTTNSQGEREELKPIRDDHGWSIDATEFGRVGTFMDHYIGKQYMTLPMREVLSTGAEGLFTDRFGAFQGLMGQRKDLDHRGFTMGVFALI